MRALVTGGTSKDSDAMAVLAMNVADKCPGVFDEIVIFHDGIYKDEQQKFQKIMPIRFIRYEFPIPKRKFWGNKSIKYFSTMVFCKYECFRLLDEYDEVVWSDYDVVIKSDISEILNLAKDYAFICDTQTKLKDMFFKGIERKMKENVDLGSDSICTPIFVLKRSQKVDHKEIYRECYSLTEKYAKYLYLPEQCIFTMIAQKVQFQFDILNHRCYFTHPKNDGSDVKILHAYGQPKFWNGLNNELWNQYYSDWKEMSVN